MEDTQSPPNDRSSSTIRFLGLIKQPVSDQNPFELDESDVIWSSYSPSSSSSDQDLSSSDYPNPSSDTNHIQSNSPTTSSSLLSSTPITTTTINGHSFSPRNLLGLSAALSDDPSPPLVQRKRTINPSLSATSAARTISPIQIQNRSGSSEMGGYSGSSSSLGKYNQSAPVNVPIWPRRSNRANKPGGGEGKMGFFEEAEEDDDVDEEEEMLPPHEIVAARSHMTTFSVFEGVGRTLKGRDLRRVRNAIFQKTGFLD